MTDHTVTTRTWAVVHTDPPHLVILDPGQQLSTTATVDTYTDRTAAVAALTALDSDVEAPDDPPLPAEPPAPDALTALVDLLGPEAVTRSAVLGAHLAGHAEPLWDAVAAMSPDNDARPALDIVLDSALTAALADLDTTPNQEP